MPFIFCNKYCPLKIVYIKMCPLEKQVWRKDKKPSYVNVCVSSPGQSLTVAHHDIKGQTKEQALTQGVCD